MCSPSHYVHYTNIQDVFVSAINSSGNRSINLKVGEQNHGRANNNSQLICSQKAFLIPNNNSPFKRTKFLYMCTQNR